MVKGKIFSISGGFAAGILEDGRAFNAPLLIDENGTLKIDLTYISPTIPSSFLKAKVGDSDSD